MKVFENKTVDEVWKALGDIPVNDDGMIQEEFLTYPIGSDREDIWTDIEYHYQVSLGHMFFGKSLKS